MKFSIAWHEKCAHNQIESLKREKVNLDCAIATYARNERRLAYYLLQIDSAKQSHKEGFDSERYMRRSK